MNECNHIGCRFITSCIVNTKLRGVVVFRLAVFLWKLGDIVLKGYIAIWHITLTRQPFWSGRDPPESEEGVARSITRETSSPQIWYVDQYSSHFMINFKRHIYVFGICISL